MPDPAGISPKAALPIEISVKFPVYEGMTFASHDAHIYIELRGRNVYVVDRNTAFKVHHGQHWAQYLLQVEGCCVATVVVVAIHVEDLHGYGIGGNEPLWTDILSYIYMGHV